MRHTQYLGRAVVGFVGIALGAGLSARAQDAPAASPAVAPARVDPDALARFVPAEGLVAYLEFQGLEAHQAAWDRTAASKVLGQTNTGAMLREIVLQVHAQLSAALPNRKTTSEEEVAMLEHLFRSGLVVGVNNSQGAGGGIVLVIRDAFRDDRKATFAKLIAREMKAGTKPTLEDKPGGRRVATMTSESTGQPIAWWVENRRDLVLCLPPAHADAVVAVLEKKADSAEKHPRRGKLFASAGGVEPVGGLFVDVQALGPMPPPVAQQLGPLGLDKVKSIEARWGFEGPALRSELALDAPGPHAGVLSLLDQPAFGVKDVPALPAGVESVAVVALDADATLKRAESLLETLGQADAAKAIAGLPAELKKATRLDLQQDVLAALGQRVTVYTMPPKTSGVAALNALNPLAAAQIPRFVALVEIKNKKAMERSIAQLMKFANQELAKLMPAPPAEAAAAPAPAGGSPGGYPGGGGGSAYTAGRGGGGGGAAPKRSSATAKAAPPIQLKMTSSDPVTYQLTLPAPIGLMLGTKPTLVLGPRHLIVAAGPDLAAEALKLDEAGAAAWAPSGPMAEAVAFLPERITILQVTDPKRTLPEAIVELPSAVNAAVAALAPALMPAGGAATDGATAAAAPGGGPAPGVLPQGGGGPGRRLQGASAAGGAPAAGGMGGPGSGTSSPPPNYPGAGGGSTSNAYAQQRGGAGGGAAGYPGAGGGSPGAAPAAGPAGAAAPPPVVIIVPPEKVPTADSIRSLLFPSAGALVVDDAGIRWVSRDAFFDVASLTTALKAAATARGAAATGPGGVPGAPGAAPAAPGGGAPGPSRAD